MSVWCRGARGELHEPAGPTMRGNHAHERFPVKSEVNCPAGSRALTDRPVGDAIGPCPMIPFDSIRWAWQKHYGLVWRRDSRFESNVTWQPTISEKKKQSKLSWKRYQGVLDAGPSSHVSACDYYQP